MGMSESPSLCECASRTISEVQDLVVDGCVVAMQDFTWAELSAVADQEEKINPDGWLPKLVREYLNVWREGERP
jgi:hypothetical protein